MGRARQQADEGQEPGFTGLADPGRDQGQGPLYGGGPRRHRIGQHPARVAPLCPRADGDHVRRPPLDHPSVRRLFHRQGIQRLLSEGPRRRPEGSVGGLRSRHPPRLRLRSPPGRRRHRQGRGGDRFGRGHEDPVRRHPARPDVGIDDDERGGHSDPGRLYRRRRGTGRTP